MNRARKGRELEHRARKRLEAQGYYVVRAAASLGLWDLVAIARRNKGAAWTTLQEWGPMRVVQVRSNRRPRSHEMRKLRHWHLRAPYLVRCEVWVWRDRKPAPEIEVL